MTMTLTPMAIMALIFIVLACVLIPIWIFAKVRKYNREEEARKDEIVRRAKKLAQEDKDRGDGGSE